MDTRRDFLKTMSVAGGLLTASQDPVESRVCAEETAPSKAAVSMATRTLEPGRLIPFLCLDATNQPDSIVVCPMPARKDPQPVLGKNPKVGSPDEGDLMYATVVIDPETKRFRMWYWGEAKSRLGVIEGMRGFTTSMMYAESEDGLSWERPELGFVEFRGSRKNNILDTASTGRFHPRTVLMDHTEADPRKRFKCLASTSRGAHLSYSEDGIRWRKSGINPIANKKARFHESCCFLMDPDCPDPGKRFKWFNQFPWGNDIPDPRWDCPAYRTQPGSQVYSTATLDRRRIGVAYGPDEAHMTVSKTLAMDPDEGLEQQIHLISVTPYEGYYLALYEYSWFDLEIRTDRSDLRLAVSRDGLQFERIQNQVSVVPRGPVGRWDDGNVISPNQLVKVGNELWIYYSGSPGEYGLMGSPRGWPLACEAGYGPQIGRAVLPYDGVSCVRVRPWRFRGSFRSDPMTPGKKLPEFLQANIARPPGTRPYIAGCAGPVDKAFRISVNEEDGTVVAALEPVAGREGRFKLPRAMLDRRGPKPFRFHVFIDDPYYGICSLRAL